MPRKNVRFNNQAGEALAGILDLPASRPRAYALFAHCFTCSKNLKAAAHLSQALVDAGLGVLRFDFTGLGQSDGDFADTSFSSNVDDLIVASEYLAEEHEAPQLLVGHSLGGTAVLRAAASIPSARAVATIGSPSSPTHVGHLFSDSEEELMTRGEAEVMLGGRPFRVKQAFIDDLAAHPMEQHIGGLRKALLIMHAPLDDVVEIDNASALFREALHPKSFVSLDNADHLLSREADSRYAGQVLAAWAARYLPAANTPSLTAAGDEVVARTAVGGFRTDVAAGPHRLVADEPESYGGTEQGPTPYDYLGIALATCTSMTLRMYAEHKGLDFQAATVRVRHEKIHAEDCVDCESTSGKIDQFEREIDVAGDLSDEQRARMLEIADRCPVHRTLEGEIVVRTRARP